MQAIAFLVTLATLGACLSAHAAPARFLPLGHIPTGDASSGAYEISLDGRTIVGFGRRDGAQVPVAWTLDEAGAHLVELGPLPGGAEPGTAQAVSADGSVIVGVGSSHNGREAVSWSASTYIEGLGDLEGGVHHSYANGISSDGRVIAGWSVGAAGTQAVIWTPEGMKALENTLGTSPSSASQISGDGRVVVGYTMTAKGRKAFRWTEQGGMEALEEGPGESVALAVSEDGETIGGFLRHPWGDDAFVWRSSTGFRLLGDFSGGKWDAWMLDWSTDGAIGVGYGHTEAGKTALLWDEWYGMRSVQEVLASEYGMGLPGWHLATAEGISRDKRVIAGYGTNPAGEVEGWAVILPSAVLVPEPDAALLFPVAALCLAVVRRLQVG